MSHADNTPPTNDGPPGMPQWLKVGLIVFALVLVALLAVALAGGGSHGPSMH